jgi:hypothetical protein
MSFSKEANGERLRLGSLSRGGEQTKDSPVGEQSTMG